MLLYKQEMMDRVSASGIFECVEDCFPSKMMFQAKSLGIYVEVRFEEKSDGQPWAIFNVSRKSRLVSLSDVTVVYRAFCGESRAIIPLPEALLEKNKVIFSSCAIWKIPEFK
jgi:hypothetical protein